MMATLAVGLQSNRPGLIYTVQSRRDNESLAFNLEGVLRLGLINLDDNRAIEIQLQDGLNIVL